MMFVLFDAISKGLSEAPWKQGFDEPNASLHEAHGALAELLQALGTMPYEDRTPEVHAAVARAKKVLGIED